MVDDREAETRREVGGTSSDRLVCAPGAPRHDRGRTRGGERPKRDQLLRAADERRAKIGDPTRDPRPEGCRRADPGRIAEAPTPSLVSSLAPKSGWSSPSTIPSSHAPHVPSTSRTWNLTEPGPRQRSPIRSNRFVVITRVVAAADGSERYGDRRRAGRGHRRRDKPGENDGDGDDEKLHGRSRVAETTALHKVFGVDPDRILTVVGQPHLRELPVRSPVSAGLLPTAVSAHRRDDIS